MPSEVKEAKGPLLGRMHSKNAEIPGRQAGDLLMSKAWDMEDAEVNPRPSGPRGCQAGESFSDQNMTHWLHPSSSLFLLRFYYQKSKPEKAL